MNEESSRSHLVVNMFLQSTNSSGQQLCSKLCLADLAGVLPAAFLSHARWTEPRFCVCVRVCSHRNSYAEGSERQRKSKAQGASLVEGAAINKSLSTLGNVLIALSEKRQHVPFRESKLTRLLQDCMVRSFRLCMQLVLWKVQSAMCTANALLCYNEWNYSPLESKNSARSHHEHSTAPLVCLQSRGPWDIVHQQNNCIRGHGSSCLTACTICTGGECADEPDHLLVS